LAAMRDNLLRLFVGHFLNSYHVDSLQYVPEGGPQTMGNVSSILRQLKQERDRVERQLSGLNAALTAFANVYGAGKPIRKRRKMSAKSRAKIAAAQRARWSKYRAKKQQ
jgi:hypothetical protein